ncbi:RodZ domain-containing protein [Polaromonas sp.]|uniref:helix-turn-helix domain-containing protein n=1 Tax=Polaromonas sp. TaxID=1869339 RepID=UPI003266AE2F
MSEFEGSPAMSQDEALRPGAGGQFAEGSVASAGSLIRQAREAAGLHIAALAVALKVPVRKLEALEADRLDLLPDAVFVRALAASVCRTLKIDAGQVLALLPQTGKPSLGQQHTPINAPFRSPGDGPGPSLLAQVSRPAVLAGLLLVLAALVLIFLPAVQQSGPGEPATAVSAPATPQGGPSGVVVARTEPTGNDKPAEPSGPDAGMQAAPALAPQLSAAPALSLPVPEPAAPAVLAEPAQPAPTGIIVFRAKGESWVEVTDARGTVVVRRTLAAGEQVGASGVLPLSAVVGRADATIVEVRGKVFDLNPVRKDNVARFEVK